MRSSAATTRRTVSVSAPATPAGASWPSPRTRGSDMHRPCRLEVPQATSQSLDREVPAGGLSGMPQERLTDLAGSRGRIALHEWRAERPRYVALIAHGYGEHARRYAHVAEHLVR